MIEEAVMTNLFKLRKLAPGISSTFRLRLYLQGTRLKARYLIVFQIFFRKVETPYYCLYVQQKTPPLNGTAERLLVKFNLNWSFKDIKNMIPDMLKSY